MSPIKNNYKCGMCDVCEDGRIQFDKENQYYYCMDCHKIWNEDTWQTLVDYDNRNEYNPRDYEDNLQDLNFLGRPKLR